MGFIRKVYGILMVQLAITVGFICLFLYQQDLKLYVALHTEVFWIAFVLLFIVMMVLVCCDNVRRSFPINLICLILFTLLESFLLGSAASFYDAESVLIAVGICAVVCLGLTIFAFQTKWDFTMFSGMLLVVLLVLLMFGFLAILIPSKVFHIIYASLGAVVFSMYIVFDTQLMLGNNHRYSISPEEYITAALNLYLDIINLFLMILSLVSSARN